MAIVDVRHEVVLALAHIHEAQREAKSLVDHGEDDERVFAAGELDFLERQEGMLNEPPRRYRLAHRRAPHLPFLVAPGMVQPDVPPGQLDRPRLKLRLAPSHQSRGSAWKTRGSTWRQMRTRRRPTAGSTAACA